MSSESRPADVASYRIGSLAVHENAPDASQSFSMLLFALQMNALFFIKLYCF